jgi:hypothetical protein
MSLFISNIGHDTTVLDAVKKNLFPICKFVTSNSNLDYDVKEEVCAFMIAHCQVTLNSRWWWSHYKLKIKKTLANHRNNCIKRMQHLCIREANPELFVSSCIKITQDRVMPSSIFRSGKRQ